MSEPLVIELPSSPEDRKKVKDAIDELVDSMVRADSERTLQAEILKLMKEDYKLPPSGIRKVAKIRFKMNRAEQDQDHNEVMDALDEMYGQD